MATFDCKWVDAHIEIEPPKKPKKITGTHFPEVLGVHPYTTPFESWCRCTRLYEVPFEGNKYTHAGEVIEPKVFDFLRYSVGLGDRLITPTDIYGSDPFKKTYGDFFGKESQIFGGMWDAMIRKEDSDEIEYIVEVKTVLADGHSGSFEDRWKHGKAPDYQGLQASLYAYLKDVRKVMMVGVLLYDSKGDYEHPENVTPCYAGENVYIDCFDIYERYPNFNELVEYAVKWWGDTVLSGKSPEFDEKRDAEILKVLRSNTLNPDTDIASVMARAEELTRRINKHSAEIKADEDELKNLRTQITEYAKGKFREGDKNVTLNGTGMNWVLTYSETKSLDEKRLLADGIDVNEYKVAKPKYTLTTKNKEDK